MPGNNLIFYGTTGPGGAGDGSSEPDPTNWLGKHRASQTLHEFQSTVTTTQTDTDRHILVDTARIGDGADAHALKWLLVQTGPAALNAARIMSFDSATGTFLLDRRFTANAVATDDYAVFAPGNVFPDVTAAQCRDGDTRYRCVYMRNEHGVAITNVKHHFITLALGDLMFDRINNVLGTQPFIERSDDTTDILDAFGQRVIGGGSDNFAGCGQWNHPFRQSEAFEIDASLANNTGNAIWLRRVVPSGSLLRRSVALMVVVTTDVTGSDPDPLLGAAIIAFDVDGLTPTPTTLGEDRFVHVFGGARVEGTVLDGANNPVVGLPVQMRVKAGDPGTFATDDDPAADYTVTDEDGAAAGTYVAPEDETEVAEMIPLGDATFPDELVNVGTGGGTIIQRSGVNGSFPTDGFKVGDFIKIEGTDITDGIFGPIASFPVPSVIFIPTGGMTQELNIPIRTIRIRANVARVELVVPSGDEVGNP